jgi:hypothetical protein
LDTLKRAYVFIVCPGVGSGMESNPPSDEIYVNNVIEVSGLTGKYDPRTLLETVVNGVTNSAVVKIVISVPALGGSIETKRINPRPIVSRTVSTIVESFTCVTVLVFVQEFTETIIIIPKANGQSSFAGNA